MSIPFFGLVIILIVEKIFHRKIFSPRDWKIASVFGMIASLVLYPSALGLTHIDTYTWGWAPHRLLVAVTLITILLLWKKNRFGIVLLLALAAFAFQMKASNNFWDYLIDPVYGLMAFGMMAKDVYNKKRLVGSMRS